MLLTRDAFRQAVFERDNYKCVKCGEPGQDAHHIMERRLWPDGGYYLDNGATVCGPCHLRAESTLLSAQELRIMAGIKTVLLPPHLYDDLEYDKWGNIIDGSVRYPGELFYDESVQKIIKPVLGAFQIRFKYPRTWHLPWSHPGKNDRKLNNTDSFNESVIQTEKMDGENTTVYYDGYMHARSVSDNKHPARNWLLRDLQNWAYHLPQGWRVCGENLYARHTIEYDDLPTYFMVFSIWDERNHCLNWSETLEWCALLGLMPVPYRWVKMDKGELKKWRVREGYVIRNFNGFDYRDFNKNVAKYVDAKFNPAGSHWKHRSVIPNKLDSRNQECYNG